MILWKQIWIFLTLFFHVDRKEKERILSYFFFSLTILLMLQMAMAEQKNVAPIQVVLTFFLGVQMLFLRVFEEEKRGGVLLLLKTYPADQMAFYLAKTAYTVFWSCLLLPFLALGCAGSDGLSGVFICGLGMSLGLSGLGVLLSGLVLKAKGQEVLFPLLFFPLTVPILLASLSGLDAWFLGEQDLFLSWLSLAFGFGIIYTTLGALLFSL